jgi:hypothetical protein
MPDHSLPPQDAGPLARWPLVCPFCRATAPLTAYDLREGGIYTCTGCQVVLRASMWHAEPRSLGHLRWSSPCDRHGYAQDDAHA